MILEEETFAAYGYYPSELKPQSHKKILAVCDDCGKVRITTKSSYAPRCKSCAKRVYANLKDYDWLYKKYHIEKASTREIAEEIGCTKGNVLRALKEQGIYRRTTAESRRLQKSKYIELNDKDWLYQRYWIDELSTYKIGEMIKCNHCLVRKALIRFEIGMRTRVESISGKLSHLWKGGLVKRICETCGKEFEVIPAVIRIGNGRFCSKSCTQKGERNPNWNGGTSFEPYCHKFDNKLREEVRERFGRLCFLCSKTEAKNGQRLSVHHIDYNKRQGCDDVEWLLVPLCISCSARTNNNRDCWQNLILNKLKEEGYSEE